MIQVDADSFNRLLNDVAIIKEFVLSGGTESEGEVTEWAKNELVKARKTPDAELIPHKKVKQIILSK